MIKKIKIIQLIQLNKLGRMKHYLGCHVADLLLCFLLPLVSITVNKSTLLDKCIRFFGTTAVKTMDRSKSLLVSFIF